MRKLSVRERVFAIGAKFDIRDEMGNEIYLAIADKFDLGKNITIYSADETIKYFHLKQVIRIGAHKYKVFNGKKENIGTVEKTFMFPSYTLNSTMGNFTMEAKNMLGRSYEIKKDGILVGKFEKPITFITDCYEIEIYNEEVLELILGLVILIDMVRFHEN